MAVDDYDAITGRPIFLDTGAPDIGVDPTAVGKYAAEVGTRIVGSTTYLNNYPYRREGLGGYDTTLGCPVTYRSGAWKREVSFRTFSTARSAMTDGALFVQVPTEDTTKDTEPAFTYTYNSGDGKLTPEAGVYMLHARSHPGAATTGTSFVQLRAATQGLLSIGPVAIASNPWMSCAALFRTDGSEGFYTEVQKVTGVSSNGSGFLSITKLATL